MLPLTEDVATGDRVTQDTTAQDTVTEAVVNETLVNETLVNETLVNETVANADAVDEVVAKEESPEAEPEAMSMSEPETATEGVNEAAQASDGVKGAAGKNDEDGMASSAERMTILRMVEQGKISAEDGARLLTALGKGQEAESTPRPKPFDTSRHLQVRVHDLVTNRQKVNVMLPVGLLQWAWRWLPAPAQEQLGQVQSAIEAGASGRLVEVVDQESGVRVEITLI
jgi:hypothetical protein